MILEDLNDGNAMVSRVTDPILLRQQLGNTVFLGVGLDFFDVDHLTAFFAGSVHKFGPHLLSYQCNHYNDWARPLPAKVRYLHNLTNSFLTATKKVSNLVEVVVEVYIPPFQAFRSGPSILSRCS